MSYPYTLKPQSIKDVFGKITSTGVPGKFTIEHLRTLGFTSSNDQALLPIFKFIGFLSTSGEPTQKYKDYRGQDGKKILGQAIKSGYSELFDLHPNADKKDEETLMHFFATKTDTGERARKATVATFKALCDLAMFDDNFVPENMPEEKPNQIGNGQLGVLPKPSLNSSNPSININIELHIPATNDPEIYNNFFKALKDNLY